MRQSGGTGGFRFKISGYPRNSTNTQDAVILGFGTYTNTAGTGASAFIGTGSFSGTLICDVQNYHPNCGAGTAYTCAAGSAACAWGKTGLDGMSAWHVVNVSAVPVTDMTRVW